MSEQRMVDLDVFMSEPEENTPDKRKRRKLSKKEREIIYQKTNGHCAYCGCELELTNMQADHIQPFYLGGSDELDNFLPSCRSCNHYKSTLSLEDFRKTMQTLPDRMLRDSVNFRNLLRFGIISVDRSPVKFYFERIVTDNA